MANFESESMLTLATCMEIARRICAGEMPYAFFISPPNLLMVLIYFWGIVDVPCKTSGTFGIFSAICFNISNRNDSFLFFRL